MVYINEIVIHDGQFHCDDVMSYVFAGLISSADSISLIRTRDTKFFKEKAGRIIIDVGEIYDPSKMMFDHHQHLSIERDSKIPYSSIGLLWKEYGIEYCNRMLSKYVSSYTNEDCLSLWNNIDKQFILGIDAVDNGLGEVNDINVISLPTIVRTFNNEQNQDYGFAIAAHICELAFMEFVKSSISNITAKKEILNDLRNPSNRYGNSIFIPNKGPWKSCIQKNDDIWESTIDCKFVWFQIDGKYNQYGVTSFPLNKTEQFTSRYNFDKNLKDKIKEITFVHKGGFFLTFESNSFDDAVNIIKRIDNSIKN